MFRSFWEAELRDRKKLAVFSVVVCLFVNISLSGDFHLKPDL